MLLFLDTANIDAIKEFAFLINGITTTPTIIKRDYGTSEEFVRIIRKDFPELEIHIEALARDAQATEELINQFCANSWYDSEKIVFKIPISKENLQATINIKQDMPAVRINLHMIFSAAQATVAMHVQPAYIAPLLGRYADRVASLSTHSRRSPGNDAGHNMLEEIMKCKHMINSDAVILASSIRTINDFVNAVTLGADAITLPPAVLKGALSTL